MIDGMEKEIALCQAEIKDLQFRLAVAENTLPRLIAASQSTPARSGSSDVHDELATKGGPRPAGSRVKGSLVDTMITVMREANRPMSGTEIARAVEAKGVTTNAKRGLGVMVSGSLCHDKATFERVSYGVYQLKRHGGHDGQKSTKGQQDSLLLAPTSSK